jgi:hypothetical protein
MFRYKSVNSTNSLKFLRFHQKWVAYKHFQVSVSTICKKLFHEATCICNHRTQESAQLMCRVSNQEPSNWSQKFKTPILIHLLPMFVCANEWEILFNIKAIKTPVSKFPVLCDKGLRQLSTPTITCDICWLYLTTTNTCNWGTQSQQLLCKLQWNKQMGSTLRNQMKFNLWVGLVSMVTRFQSNQFQPLMRNELQLPLYSCQLRYITEDVCHTSRARDSMVTRLCSWWPCSHADNVHAQTI